ncbi:MAG: hypothetical protein NUV65_03055 [Candidatus Roizmanbacteria bacterium]|nr:hypothetical protein [Candidatus Roizmanbacteria bacterium]
MPAINRTAINPHGLSIKQEATIALVENQIKRGEPISLSKAHNIVYKTKGNGDVIAHQNLHTINYREAFIERMRELNITGKNGKIERVMTEGLESEKVYNKQGDTAPDYATRLSYAQELHKIIGAYAPTQSQQSSVSVNLDVTPNDLDERITMLSEELQE